MSGVLLSTPTYGRAKVGRPARTYIQQLCEDTGCGPEDLPEAMNDREQWRKRVWDIRASGTTWWWCLICTYFYRLSPWSGWTAFLPSVAHWRRYFGIWLREGSQVLPVKTPCLPQIFHRRIDRATRDRRLSEQTPPRFSPEPLWPGCGPKYRWVPDQYALDSPIRNRSSRWHSSGTTYCHRPTTLRRGKDLFSLFLLPYQPLGVI